MTPAARLLALLALASGFLGTADAGAAPLPRAVEGELLVGLRQPPAPGLRGSLPAELGTELLGEAVDGRVLRVRRLDGDLRTLGQLADAWRDRPEVLFVHPNWLGQGGFTPNDSAWPALWHHHNAGQSGGTAGADLESEPGWELGRGSASVVVAVLDTGIDSDHPEFAGRLLSGWDFVNGDADPEDDNGHGTWVTGVLAADADNGFGTAGVDHACSILPVKILDASNSGTTFALIQGLDLARTGGADVVNMSLIGYPQSAALSLALANAHDAGLVLVACAGNSGIGNADTSWPGASPYTICVGATTALDVRAPFSGTGSALEFVAPGKDVPTVLYNSHANGTAIFTGCSAAVPIVTGIVSILKAIDPALDTAGARALLQAGAEDLVGSPDEDVPGWDAYHGWGRVNLRRTLEAAGGAVGSPRSPTGALCTLDILPNPVHAGTSLHVTLPVDAHLSLAVFDVTGRRVRTLHDGPWPAGQRARGWDGTGERGERLAPGVYFVRAEALGEARVRKATLVR